MLHLSLAGLSGDGKRLLLVSDSGEEYTLAVDDKLRAALRGEHARLGQLEIQMESTLRPRDIQARIRGGESPESVAQAAHTTVEKILPFANPVLAERAHVAERAQRSSVRRRSGDSGARTLGEAVAAQFSQVGHSSESVEWDAWRREDNRWTLTASFAAGKKKGTARFTYDMPGNYVTMENDDARWLVGEAPVAPHPAAAPPERDDLEQARQRRLAAVPEEQLPLGDDAISLVNEPAGDAVAEESTVDLTEAAREVREAPAPGRPAADQAADDRADEHRTDGHEAAREATLEATPEPLAVVPTERYREEPAETAHADTQPDETPVAEATAEAEPAEKPAPRKPTRKRGRASVPSWDEIMFGGGKQD